MADHARAHEVATRLHVDVGVTEDQLREAAKTGLDAYRRTTPFHPPGASGYYQWSESHVALRQILRPLKWTPNDDGNFSTVVSPSGLVAITVATGDSRTGKEGLPAPTTKYPRGSMTEAAVKTNRQQLALDLSTGAVIMPPDDEEEESPRVTWWLLHHVTSHEMRLEISCPSDFRGDRINSWAHRIILEPIPVEATLPLNLEDQEVTSIDVPVERR